MIDIFAAKAEPLGDQEADDVRIIIKASELSRERMDADAANIVNALYGALPQGTQRRLVVAANQLWTNGSTAGSDERTALRAVSYWRGRAEAAEAEAAKWRELHDDRDHDLRHEYARANAAEAENARLREALADIAAQTDDNDPESYRCDDPRGCLDWVHDKATKARRADDDNARRGQDEGG